MDSTLTWAPVQETESLNWAFPASCGDRNNCLSLASLRVEISWFPSLHCLLILDVVGQHERRGSIY